MPDPVFFKPAAALTLAEIAALVGAAALTPERGQKLVRGLAAVDRAKADELTFLENPYYLEALTRSRALACLVAEKNAARVPGEVVPPSSSRTLIVPLPLSRANCFPRRYVRHRAAARKACHRGPMSTRQQDSRPASRSIREP